MLFSLCKLAGKASIHYSIIIILPVLTNLKSSNIWCLLYTFINCKKKKIELKKKKWENKLASSYLIRFNTSHLNQY